MENKGKLWIDSDPDGFGNGSRGYWWIIASGDLQIHHKMPFRKASLAVSAGKTMAKRFGIKLDGKFRRGQP